MTVNDGELSGTDELIVTVIDPPVNQAPQVYAGSNQTIELGNGALMNPTSSDDGLPSNPGTTVAQWTVDSGPGTVSFSDSTALDAEANFSNVGVYVLRLTVNDGELSSSDQLSVTVITPVNQAPLVDAGPDQTIELGSGALMSSTSSDDGLPLDPGNTTALWTMESGPGIVTFSDSTALNVVASFSEIGAYVLRLTVNDGELAAFDVLSVTVARPAPISLAEIGSGASASSTIVETDAMIAGVTEDLYIAAVSTKPLVNVNDVVGLGLQWTPLDIQCSGRNQTGLTVWVAQGIPTGDSKVSATLESLPKNAVIVVSRYTAIDGKISIGNIVSGNTNGYDGDCSGGNVIKLRKTPVKTEE
jgi:hypothetical protein